LCDSLGICDSEAGRSGPAFVRRRVLDSVGSNASFARPAGDRKRRKRSRAVRPGHRGLLAALSRARGVADIVARTTTRLPEDSAVIGATTLPAPNSAAEVGRHQQYPLIRGPPGPILKVRHPVIRQRQRRQACVGRREPARAWLLPGCSGHADAVAASHLQQARQGSQCGPL